MTRRASWLADLGTAARLVRDFPRFLGRPPGLEHCREMIARQLARRDEVFLDLIARGVLQNGDSPYRALLKQARIELGDIAAWVRRDGIEGALGALYEAGVYVTLDEFKGRRPIRRQGLELAVRDRAFDNPLVAPHYEGSSGGTRGAGTRTQVDLGLLAYEAAYELITLDAASAVGQPGILWRPALPLGAGMKAALRHASLGLAFERWFSQTPVTWSAGKGKYYLFLRYAVAASRRYGHPIPMPEHTPVDRADVVARWLADRAAEGRPGWLDTNVASAVRICLGAAEHGLDIRGTLFRTGSEPLTGARARIIAEAGCRALCHYAMAEVGHLGVSCPVGVVPDEVHVAQDKIALLQRDRPVEGATVGALFCTTIHPASPKLMLNVELGDYGVLSERACGCPFERLGLSQHLHGILSYEKLTTEGMHFMGTHLVQLVEEVLPARFGGHPTDYQLVEEEEEGGVVRVNLVVSPRVGALAEADVVAAALQSLASPPGGENGEAMMAGYWRQAGTLRLVRREPYATGAAKILPLHVIRGDGHRPG